MRSERGGSHLLVPTAAAVAGAALAGGAEAGVALLLFTGERMLATAGFLLAVVLAAVGAALWAGPPARRPAPTLGRWVAAAAAFALAAAFAELWGASGREGLGAALGVLLLLAAPAYAVTAVIVALQTRGSGVPVAALFGAALGVLFASAWGIPRIDPGPLFLGATGIMLLVGSLESRAHSPDARRGTDRMDGKVVIVTGVGRRGQVGYAVARMFLDRGAKVVVTGSSPEAEVLAWELNDDGRTVGLSADLTMPEEAERVVAAAREHFGRLDILVNVAGGLTVIKPLAETTPEEWSSETDRNALTAFVMSRAALPLLRESRGSIVNFASPAGVRAAAGVGAYSAAKAGVVALTRALALEERAHGVRVNAIAPGMIDTEQNRESVKDPEKVRWVTREQVAEVVLFLAGEAGSGVNGETVGVGG